MAQVVSTGGVVTLLRLNAPPSGPEGTESADGGEVNISSVKGPDGIERELATGPPPGTHSVLASQVNFIVRLYAKLESGMTVFDPLPNSMGIGVDKRQVPDLEDAIRRGLQSEQASAGIRHACWHRLIGALAQFGIEIDAETLLRLPFDFLPDREVQDAMRALSTD